MKYRSILCWAVVAIALAPLGCGQLSDDKNETNPSEYNNPNDVSKDGLWSTPGTYASFNTSATGGDGSGDGAMMESGSAYPTSEGETYDSEDWDEGGYSEEGGEGGYSGEGGDEGGYSDPYIPAPSGVKAGVYNDNSDFDSYLEYLNSFSQAQLEFTYPIDVGEKYTLSIKDGSMAIANVKIVITANGDTIFIGKTTADGQVLFHPNAHNVASATTSFDYTINQGDGEIASGSFERSAEGAELTLQAQGSQATEGVVRIDLALVVDTTGSMGDEINKLKATWLTIVDQITSMDIPVDLRFALVVYRDRGDEYVVKYLDFIGDSQTYMTALEEVHAGGGGDLPEDLEAALDITYNYLNWDPNADARIAFTLADAPPHIYDDVVTYPTSLKRAVELGIRTHSIAASGSSEDAEYVLRQIAQFTQGHFLFLTYDNDVPGKPGSGTGSGGDDGYNVEQFLSGSLDELVVALVKMDIDSLLATE
jgi:hypothetical protein